MAASPGRGYVVGVLIDIAEGLGAGIVAVLLVVLSFFPSTVVHFLPKLGRTWKGKRT